jgi:hypothetical protein
MRYGPYLKAEDISTTRHDSGWIDREGKFYGGNFAEHYKIAEKLCRRYKFSARSVGIKLRGDIQDYERILDKKGFIKISRKHFYWDNDIRPNDVQIKAMADFMMNHKMKTARFNLFYLSDPEQTLAEAFPDY